MLLLEPLREPIHASELAHRAFADAVVEEQPNLAVEDRKPKQAMAGLTAVPGRD